jgi:hypothetical protein
MVMRSSQSLIKAVKLIAWNIQHGGGTRLARIVEEISAYYPDVIAVTEFRARPGEALCVAMKEMGLPHVETTHPADKQNVIAVFSPTPIRVRGVVRHLPQVWSDGWTSICLTTPLALPYST